MTTTPALKVKPDLFPVSFKPTNRLDCVRYNDYRLVRTTHRWHLRVNNEHERYSHQVYLCTHCNSEISLIIKTRHNQPTVVTAMLRALPIQHFAWQNVDDQMQPCSLDTYGTIFQAELDLGKGKLGLHRLNEPPTPRPDTGPECREGTLPATTYEEINKHHNLDPKTDYQWNTLAGNIRTVKCRRCQAVQKTITFKETDQPALCTLVREPYGASQAWQNIDGNMMPTNLDTAAAIIKGYTATERLRKSKLGLPLEFRRTILKPSWRTAMEDLRLAARQEP